MQCQECCLSESNTRSLSATVKIEKVQCENLFARWVRQAPNIERTKTFNGLIIYNKVLKNEIHMGG